MARPKRKHPLAKVARDHVNTHMPELKGVPVRIRQLDGPPEAPRYAVMAETCSADECPHGIPLAVSAAGNCPVKECALRHSLRLLLDRRGNVVQSTTSDIHWT